MDVVCRDSAWDDKIFALRRLTIAIDAAHCTGNEHYATLPAVSYYAHCRRWRISTVLPDAITAVTVGRDLPTVTQPEPTDRTGDVFAIVFTVGLFGWFLTIAADTYAIFSASLPLSLQNYKLIFTDLPKRFDLLILLITFFLSAIGPGLALLSPLRLQWRGPGEHVLFAGAIGLAAFTFVFLAIGTFWRLTLAACYVVYGVGLGITAAYFLRAYLGRRRRRPRPHMVLETSGSSAKRAGTVVMNIWLSLLLLLFLYIAFLGALTPEIGFDARWYHLGPARTFVEEERFTDYVEETNMRAAALDVYQVVLYTVLWKFDNMIAAKSLHWGNGVLTVLAILSFCRVFFRSSTIGLLAALVYISTPAITWSMGTGGNDLQLSFFTLLSVHAFLRWREQIESPRWLVVAGMTGGYALGSKWIGALSLLLIGGAILLVVVGHGLVQRRLRALPGQLARNGAAFACGVLLCSIPWLLRAYALTDNPLYPYFGSIFPSPYPFYADNFGGENARAMSLTDPLTWFTILRDNLTLRIPYRANLGPIFIFAVPLCLLTLLFHRSRATVILRYTGVFVAFWLILWYAPSVGELRYLAAVLPIMAILVGYSTLIEFGSRWQGVLLQSTLRGLVVVMVVLNLHPFVSLQRGSAEPGAFAQAHIDWDYLYGQKPEEAVQLIFIPMVQYINTHLSPDEDKIYDRSSLILYAAYSDIPLYSATPSIQGAPAWDIFGNTAIAHLEEIGATYASVTAAEVPRVAQAPVANCLREVMRTPDEQVLYKIEYARVVDKQVSRCVP